MSHWLEVHKGQLPRGPGVYVVYQDGVVVYVGSTTVLSDRCRVYRRKASGIQKNYGERDPNEGCLWTPWGPVAPGAIRIKVKQSRRLGDWLMWEYRLISRLQPRYNRAGIKG